MNFNNNNAMFCYFFNILYRQRAEAIGHRILTVRTWGRWCITIKGL